MLTIRTETDKCSNWCRPIHLEISQPSEQNQIRHLDSLPQLNEKHRKSEGKPPTFDVGVLRLLEMPALARGASMLKKVGPKIAGSRRWKRLNRYQSIFDTSETRSGPFEMNPANFNANRTSSRRICYSFPFLFR
jgi:hypothetical protein